MSGFLVMHDGYVITSEHVAGNYKRMEFQPQAPGATLIAAEEANDLALLKTDWRSLRLARIVRGVVEELEKAHIYIAGLSEQNDDLRAQSEALEDRLARLEALLDAGQSTRDL